jgi:hypothetical protein
MNSTTIARGERKERLKKKGVNIDIRLERTEGKQQQKKRERRKAKWEVPFSLQ